MCSPIIEWIDKSTTDLADPCLTGNVHQEARNDALGLKQTGHECGPIEWKYEAVVALFRLTTELFHNFLLRASHFKVILRFVYAKNP